MAVIADHTRRSGYRVWQKGPATGHTWQQTATDLNAYDRPAIIAYLTKNQLDLSSVFPLSRRLGGKRILTSSPPRSDFSSVIEA